MSEQKQQVYEFDNFRLDLLSRKLRRDGSPVALPAKAFDMLVVLVESAGRLVEKDELLTRVWPDQIVEESNLTVHISAIRKVLGERKDNPHYLATVRGHGSLTGNLLSLDSEEKESVVLPKTQSSLTGESESAADENSFVSQVIAQNVAPPSPKDEPAASVRDKLLGRRHLLLGGLAVIVISLVIFLGFKRAEAPDRNAALTQIKSIAVLPFKPLVSSEREESLEIGMADAR